MRKSVLHIRTLTWWEILRRAQCSRHAIERLPVDWSIGRNMSVRLYCSLASLSLSWLLKRGLIGPISSIMYSLWRYGRIWNAIAKNHTAKLSFEIVTSGHRLWCVRRVASMILSRRDIDLRGSR